MKYINDKYYTNIMHETKSIFPTYSFINIFLMYIKYSVYNNLSTYNMFTFNKMLNMYNV
jgi:hypothetical protein